VELSILLGSVVANRIAKWNGTNWSALGSGIDLDFYVDHPTSVNSLAVNNGELYVGGSFDTAGTVLQIVLQNGMELIGRL
jgi:hypothetical protein